MKNSRFDGRKFRELLLYIAERSVEDANFGATKLNKILFFSDFITYGKYGRSITGAHYRRLENGPAPKELPAQRDRLLGGGDAEVYKRPHYGHFQERLQALREPDLSLFGGQEIAVVDEVIAHLQGLTAARVSALSHDIAWSVANNLEEIPYEAVFISGEPPTPGDIKRGLELAKEHGWLATA